MGEAEAMGGIDQMVDYNTPRMAVALGAATETTIAGGVRYID